MSTPILPFAVWASGTNQNSITANDNSLRNQILNGLVIGVENDAPGGDADGDIYIVGDTPAGAFAGFDENDLAIYMDGTWYAFAPVDGIVVNVAGTLKAWDGSAYVDAGGGGAVDSVNGKTGAVSLALDDLSDVDAAAPTDGYALTWNNGAGKWEPAAPSGGMSNPMSAVGDIIYGGSSGTPTRLAAGTDGYVLTLVSGVPAWVAAGGGGGLTNWTDGLNSSSPNATVPVAYLSATNAATNVDAAIVPKGTGAFSLHIADGTSAGGNKRGVNAADLQTVRSSASQVASGSRSFVVGWNNTASAQGAVAVGGNSTASAQHAFAAGDTCTASGTSSVAIGPQGAATANYAVALGGGTADAVESHAYGRGATTNGVIGVRSRAMNGGPPNKELTLQISTTDATPATMTSNGSAAAATNQVYMGNQNNRSAVFVGYVAARQTGNGGGKKTWKFEGHLDRDNGTLALVAAVTPTVIADSGVGWSIAITADNALKTLKVEVTGAAATTIRWAANIQWQECAGA